jgi:pimeloyl-ACP methyl ester carboxylesterase
MQVTCSLMTLAQYVVTRLGLRVYLRMTVLCLILMSIPFTLSGQSCSSLWTCDCSTVTMNSGYCGTCVEAGDVAAMGSAYAGGDWHTAGDAVFQQCMAQIQPPAPPAPTATPSPGAQCMLLNVLRPSPLEERRSATLPIGKAQGSQPQRRVARPMSSGGSFPQCSIQFVDPVPSLQTANPAQLKSDDQALANLGSPVYGIAADGVAQVVLRIGANYAGQQITLSMLDEAGGAVAADVSGQPGVYGWLSSVNGSEHLSQLPVTARQVDGIYMAFAVYHAPIDFSRSAQSPATNDDAAISRTIQFNAVPAAASDTSFNITSQLVVWRPPVVLVHGLWDDESSWLTFSPFVTDNRFFINFVDYSYSVSVSAPDPPILNPIFGGNLDLSGMRANALGFDYNAPAVLDAIQDYIRMFRTFRSAAAARADIVAHSMGGLVSRTLIGRETYKKAGAGRDSFGQGSIHKLITIGTPHYGTKLAGDLLASPCMAGMLAYFNDMYSFRTATMNGTSDSANLTERRVEDYGARES